MCHARAICLAPTHLARIGNSWPRRLDRLAGFAADVNNLPNRRREAGSVVELFQQRGKEHAARSVMQPPALRPIGLLMLVPPAFA